MTSGVEEPREADAAATAWPDCAPLTLSPAGPEGLDGLRRRRRGPPIHTSQRATIPNRRLAALIDEIDKLGNARQAVPAQLMRIRMGGRAPDPPRQAVPAQVMRIRMGGSCSRPTTS